MIPRIVRRAATRLALIAAVCALPIAGVASAATPAQASTEMNCQFRDGNLTPFTAWGDTNQYFTLVGGQFIISPAGAGWALSAGTGIVSGNEPWKVISSTDSSSLRIPASGSATTQWFCIHPNEPTVRFFAKGPGVKGSQLTITMTAYFQATPGAPYGSTPVTSTYTIDGSSSAWAVTPVLALPQKAGAAGSMVQVKMASSSAGAWQVDDFEVDPWKSR